MTTVEPSAPRLLPTLDDVNRPYWTGGAHGQLLICRCGSCGHWVHPPAERCSDCDGVLTPEPVSGRGAIFTFTVNHHAYNPTVPPPYVIAIVELDEQTGLRLPTNIVNCDLDHLACGQRVRVLFEQQGEIFVPLFEPA